MGIYIGMFEFIGPDISAAALAKSAGVYAVIHESQGEFELVTVGQSNSLYESGVEIDLEALQKNYPGKLSFAIYETDVSEEGRKSIVEAIELEFADDGAALCC